MAGAVCALLLAAGESTRMGQPKPLLPWGDSTLVAWQVAQLHAAGVDEVVVVLGSRAELVRPVAEAESATVVINERFREGRASSVRAGAAAITDDPSVIVVLSVDQPRPSWVTRRLIEAQKLSNAPLVAPSYEGRGGHPLIVAAELLSELREVVDETQGLRAVTERHKSEMEVIPINNPCVIGDLNSPGDYDRALRAFNNGEWDEKPAPPIT